MADYDPSQFENMTITNTGNDNAQFVAASLQEAVKYVFEISAINQVGEGPAVTCSQLTNEDGLFGVECTLHCVSTPLFHMCCTPHSTR